MNDRVDVKSRRLWNVAIALLAVVAVSAVGVSLMYRGSLQTVTSARTPAGSTLIDTTRPGFTLRDLEGIPRTVSAWDGKVLVLNFWATWCQPCLREIPLFNRLQDEHGAAGLQFVGIAIDDGDAVRDFLKTTAIRYPVLSGQQDAVEVAQRYGNDIGILPYTAVVDRAGTIRFLQFGEIDETVARNVLEPLL